MCGIFAWSGKDPRDFDKRKFDLLGILNEERGTDSCGVTVDGKIHTGVFATKVYRDFIADKGYPLPLTNPVVIGHTRRSSVGIKNEVNCHPFGFGKVKDGYEFIGVHNGTLLNHKDIAPTYNVSLKANLVDPPKIGLQTRDKIDSELLLECIYESKGFRPLGDYNGGAAIICTNTNNANELYLYHGASLLKNYTQDGVFEERPLYFWQENENSMYVSSLKDSLIIIGGTEETIDVIPHNRVYKVVDGKIDKTQTVIVDRDGKYQSEAANPNRRLPNTSNPNYGGGRHASFDNHSHYNNNLNSNRREQTRLPLAGLGKNTASVKIEDKNNIHKERSVFNVVHTKERAIFKNFRYFRNNCLLNGHYIYIKGYGFYKIGDTFEESDKNFKKLINVTFSEANFTTISKSFERPDYIPLMFANPESVDLRPYIQYLYKGIHIKTSFDYYACIDMEKSGRAFDFMALSACSKHPVIDITKFASVNTNQLIYNNNQLYTGVISPLGSDRNYTVVKGNCVNMVICKDILDAKGGDARTIDKVKVIPITNLEDNNILKEAESDLLTKEKIKSNKEQEDLLNEILEDTFNKDFQTIPNYLKKLEMHDNMPKAIKAIEVLNTYMDGIQEIIGVEDNND